MGNFIIRAMSFLTGIGRVRGLFLFLMLAMLAFSEPVLFSRAGGGGGGGGSFGGGGSSRSDRSWSRSSSSDSTSDSSGGVPLPFFLHPEIFMALLSIAAAVVLMKADKKLKTSPYPYLDFPGLFFPSIKLKDNKFGFDDFIAANPDFDEAEFREKVKTAFIKIQDAWEAQDLSKVRHFISDGVYQRFNTQFKMMSILDQKNLIDDLTVKEIVLDKARIDGLYDIIHVGIKAYIKDHYVSKKFPGLNNGCSETFVEYWSFIRKRGAAGKDIYSTMNCPQCGAELPSDGGEVACCCFCKTIINSGDYDWVLSEITQAQDYVDSKLNLLKSANLEEKVRLFTGQNDDFSLQFVEDRASNGYLQVLTAFTLQKPELMRRFVSDKAFEMLAERIGSDEIVYNRLYLNDVSLLDIREDGELDTLLIAVRASFMRVKKMGAIVEPRDNQMDSVTRVLFMSRKKGARPPKGSLYAHSCPACAAPLEDTIDLNCSSCSTLLNSPAHEWIVSDIMSEEEFKWGRK